jgi:hypothetical protein
LMWRRRREQAIAERVAQDAGCHLVRMRESPDAELSAPGGLSIGLEIVGVVDQEFLDARRRMAETTEAIERALLDSGLQVQATIGFALQSFGVARNGASHKKWLRGLDLAKLLSTQASGELDEDAIVKAGIERISWLSWHPSPTPGVGWGYCKRTERGRTLVDLCLAKKHQKLVKYKAEPDAAFDAFWLAFDSLGPGTVEDGGYSMLLERDFETTYDRVILMVRGDGREFSEARDVTPRSKLI